jgi:hypothetical protein
MPFLVSEIKDKEGMDDFLSIPSEIYRSDPNWIVPLNSELRILLDPQDNPYFKNIILKIYVCYDSSKPVSRSILVVNHLYWQKWNRKSAFFGFFESYNDKNAVKCLFDRMETDSRAAGAEYLEGPFNPNHYSELGILTDNFISAPLFFETYNPSYYSELLNDAGFSELKKLHTMINYDIRSTIENKYGSSTDQAIKNKITIRKLNIFRLKRDLEILRDINNDAFENNQFFLPLSHEEYKFSAKYLFFVSTPGLILIAEYQGKPVGAAQFAVNINSLIKPLKGSVLPWNIPGLLWKRRKVKELVLFTVGIKKAFRHTRVFSALLKSAVHVFRNFQTLSTTWISDDSLSENLTQLLDLKPYKHFSIFSKHL